VTVYDPFKWYDEKANKPSGDSTRLTSGLFSS
jgi:hypothetical protein